VGCILLSLLRLGIRRGLRLLRAGVIAHLRLPLRLRGVVACRRSLLVRLLLTIIGPAGIAPRPGRTSD